MDARESAQILIQYEDNPAQAPPKAIQDCLSFINRKYKSLALVAVGGEGIVIKALDETGQKICIKICKAGLVKESAKVSHNAILINVAKFMRGKDSVNVPEERFKAGSILQRNLCKELLKERIPFFSVPQVLQISSEPFLHVIMDWIETPNLIRWLTEKNNIAYSLQLFQKLLGGVIFLHERGILHRDWKAENIKIGDKDSVVVLDWTLAKELGDRGLTIPGTQGGTPGFAPGKFIEERNFKAANYLDDLYSLGFLFWEICTQQRLPALRAQDCTAKNIEDFRRTLVDFLPDACQSVFWKATEQKEKDRFQTAKDFQKSITELIGYFSSNQIFYQPKKAPEIVEEIIDTNPNPVEQKEITFDTNIYDCSNCGKCNGKFPCKNFRKSIIDIVLEMKKRGLI